MTSLQVKYTRYESMEPRDWINASSCSIRTLDCLSHMGQQNYASTNSCFDVSCSLRKGTGMLLKNYQCSGGIGNTWMYSRFLVGKQVSVLELTLVISYRCVTRKASDSNSFMDATRRSSEGVYSTLETKDLIVIYPKWSREENTNYGCFQRYSCFIMWMSTSLFLSRIALWQSGHSSFTIFWALWYLIMQLGCPFLNTIVSIRGRLGILVLQRASSSRNSTHWSDWL